MEGAKLRPTTELLKTVPLLGDLDESELRQIAAFFTEITLSAGQALYAEGSAAESACFLIEGELDAFAELPGGGEALVGAITPGDIIGEMALLNGGRRTASVRARTDATALEVSSAFFQASLGHLDLPAHKILRRVISGLASRLNEVCDKIIVQMVNRAGETGAGPEVPADPAGHGETEAFDFRPFLPLLAFFRDFHPGEIDRLLSFGKVLERPKRSRLYEAGTPATSAYLVIRGSVGCSVRSGGNLQLSVIGPGRICGANEMINRRDRKTDAVTRTGALLLELDRAAFEHLFNGETPECLKFQKAVGINQLGDMKSANNLLALLVNQAHIQAGPAPV